MRGHVTATLRSQCSADSTWCSTAARVAADAWPRRQAASLVKVLALSPGRQLHREQVIDRAVAGPQRRRGGTAAAQGSPTMPVAPWVGTGRRSCSAARRSRCCPMRRSSSTSTCSRRGPPLRSSPTARAAAAAAVDAYGGTLLPGGPLRNVGRERRREHAQAALLGSVPSGGPMGRLLVEDPADEEANVALMSSTSRRATIVPRCGSSSAWTRHFAANSG